jgi:Leucine-rich repeat (LRR) protein
MDWSFDSCMLNLKVGSEWDQPLPEVHDLPQAMFGLESYVKRVETLVTSKESDAAPLHVGVWGMGGVGKTLLLQRLYGSTKVHGHFKEAKFIWCTVGQTPDIMALYQTLSAELGFEPEKTVNPEDYKLKLHSQFRQKRVFLVLDDVWHNKAFQLLDLAKGRGSVTLLSTRNLSLLDRASPHIRQEHMTPLSKVDSWSLFCVHAFRSPSNFPSELKALAQSMAEECQGLPLALKVIGEAMFGETLPEQWKLLLKRLRESHMQERTVEEELYERLKLGYDLLSEDDRRLKDCFLYFAAYPEDCAIYFNKVLWHWIGEGLVPGNGGDDPRADAVSLLNKLWRRSFIESNVKISGERGFRRFKVHDVMRDLAFYILENDSGTPPAKQLYLCRAGQNLEEFPQEWQVISKARRLSLLRNELKRLPRRFCAPDLLSLLLGGNLIDSLPGSFLWSFGKLRVLDLSHGEFDSLPEELGDLKDLVWLDLSGCHNLEILPDAVRKLHVLKCLDLTHCRSLKYLPSGVVGLTSLQKLHTRVCENLTWAEHTPSGMATAESLCHVYPTVGASLEDICGLGVLTKLSIFGKIDQGVELPHNICALTKLKFLELALENVKTLPAEMPYRFIQLQTLSLFDLRLEYLPRSFTCSGAFPALIMFRIAYLSLVEFPEVDEGALPKLQTLHFIDCQSLETLPLSLKVLTSLNELGLWHCKETLKDSCRTNCEKSSIWRRFDIRYGYRTKLFGSWIDK